MTTAYTSSQSDQFFHRPDLARAIADQALDMSLGISGGLFLAAPRRTGKSTFVRQDLLPEVMARGLLVIYVDLWTDKAVNPAIHIASAVREAIAREEGPAAAGLRKLSKIGKINLSAFGTGVGFDLSQLGLAEKATLVDAMKTLSQASKQKIVLVIDEAQHALTTAEGSTALFSLKAARDSLNSDAGLYGLQLIATGSNRDKLASLVNNKDQAFYGADMSSFPPLGIDYVKWQIERARQDFDVPAAFQVFKSLGNRREPFMKALRQTLTHMAAYPNEMVSQDELLANNARDVASNAKADFLNAVVCLAPLQSTLLKELVLDAKLSSGVARPGVFSAQMKARLEARLMHEMGSDHGVAFEAPSVQNALEGLLEAHYLWKSQLGTYSIEDDQYLEWLTDDESVDSDGDTAPLPAPT